MSCSRRASTVLWLCLCVAACGGGSGGAPSPAPDPSPSPSPSPGPAPTPQPSPTAPPSGTPDLQIERLDATAECAGVVPDGAPAVVTISVAAPAGAVCLGGTGDGTGHVAVGYTAGGAGTWTVFSANGGRVGQVTESGLDDLVREAQGWHGVAKEALYSPFSKLTLLRISPEGAVTARSQLEPPAGSLLDDVRLTADPSGGSAVAAAYAAVAGNHSSGAEAVWFDAAGAATGSPAELMSDTSPSVSFLGIGVSTGGEAIATWRTPGLFNWAWLSRDGAVLRQASVAQSDVRAADPVLIEPLLDGAVAIRFAGSWSTVVARAATTASPAPDWLAGRRTTLRFTRGARAYAVLPAAGEQLPDCVQVVELRGRSGRLCGRIAIREGSSACVGARVEQAWDGTLIQASPRDACSSTACSCTVRTWPRLLAGP